MFNRAILLSYDSVSVRHSNDVTVLASQYGADGRAVEFNSAFPLKRDLSSKSGGGGGKGGGGGNGGGNGGGKGGGGNGGGGNGGRGAPPNGPSTTGNPSGGGRGNNPPR